MTAVVTSLFPLWRTRTSGFRNTTAPTPESWNGRFALSSSPECGGIPGLLSSSQTHLSTHTSIRCFPDSSPGVTETRWRKRNRSSGTSTWRSSCEASGLVVEKMGRWEHRTICMASGNCAGEVECQPDKMLAGFEGLKLDPNRAWRPSRQDSMLWN